MRSQHKSRTLNLMRYRSFPVFPPSLMSRFPRSPYYPVYYYARTRFAGPA